MRHLDLNKTDIQIPLIRMGLGPPAILQRYPSIDEETNPIRNPLRLSSKIMKKWFIRGIEILISSCFFLVNPRYNFFKCNIQIIPARRILRRVSTKIQVIRFRVANPLRSKTAKSIWQKILWWNPLVSTISHGKCLTIILDILTFAPNSMKHEFPRLCRIDCTHRLHFFFSQSSKFSFHWFDNFITKIQSLSIKEKKKKKKKKRKNRMQNVHAYPDLIQRRVQLLRKTDSLQNLGMVVRSFLMAKSSF